MDEENKTPTIIARAFIPEAKLTPDCLTVAQWNLLSDQLALDFPRVDDSEGFSYARTFRVGIPQGSVLIGN